MNPVTHSLLQELAALAPRPEPQPYAGGRPFDLEGWIARHGLTVASHGPWAGGRKWVLNPCPWNAEHTNRAAFIVQFASGAIAAGCHHNGCQGQGWHQLRDLVEPGWRERGQPRTHAANGNGQPAALPAPVEPAEWEPFVPLATVPEAFSFPLDVLPTLLQRFVREVSQAKHAPLDYAAVPLLVIAGGAVGASRALTIKPGWSERPGVYGAVVSPPGSAKTPAIKDIALPVYAEQARLRSAWKALRSSDATAKLKTVFVSDITTEALAKLLQENPRGVSMIRDELAAWAASMDQYKAAGRGADRQVYLQSWSGEPISVHRKVQEDGPIFVAHPFVSIVGGLTPSSLPRLCGDGGSGRDDGFLDRILFCFPDPTPVQGEDWRAVSEEAAGFWSATLRKLWDLEPEQTEDGPRPRFLRLSSSGRSAWERFTALLASQMNAEDFPDYLRGPWSKMRGYGARLALILHCLHLTFGCGDPDQVGGEAIESASRLVAYFQSHARKVYAAFDADPQLADCKRLLKWIKRERKTQFKCREALGDLAGKSIRHNDDLERLLRRLAQHHYVRYRDADRTGKTGRPSAPFWEVNPDWSKKNYPLPANPAEPAKLGEVGIGEGG